ncbi:MAG: thioredoxin family protein [Chloroflexota bacterium]
MLERAAFVLLLVLATVVAALVVRRRAQTRAAAAEGQALPATLRAQLPADASAVLYFYGPQCGACRQQAAILDQLVQRESVTVVRLDAVVQTEVADSLGIATVPATAIIAPGGTVKTINLGPRSLHVLAAQLREAVAIRAVA